MGMSLRIVMQSPISLTLKPRVGITLIAASHDSLNTLLSLSVFPSLTTISETARVQKCRASASIGPLTQIQYVLQILQQSISKPFYACSYLLQKWIKFLTHCKVS